MTNEDVTPIPDFIDGPWEDRTPDQRIKSQKIGKKQK